MPRRVNLPGAEELFRPTAKESGPRYEPSGRDAVHDPDEPVEERRLRSVPEDALASGRVKHDEKMTVYVTSEELLAVERARLELRAALGRSIDRGRFVRAAVALALADLDERGADSDVARRLSDS